eukprot:3715113-Amphidinium_carterae.1
MKGRCAFDGCGFVNASCAPVQTCTPLILVVNSIWRCPQKFTNGVAFCFQLSRHGELLMIRYAPVPLDDRRRDEHGVLWLPWQAYDPHLPCMAFVSWRNMEDVDQMKKGCPTLTSEMSGPLTVYGLKTSVAFGVEQQSGDEWSWAGGRLLMSLLLQQLRRSKIAE